MKIRMYIDLPDDGTITSEDTVFASANPVSQKMVGWARYAIDVDLPVKHFKIQADRKIEAVTVGKEEE